MVYDFDISSTFSNFSCQNERRKELWHVYVLQTPRCSFSLSHGVTSAAEKEEDEEEEEEEDYAAFGAYVPSSVSSSSSPGEDVAFSPSVGDLVDLKCEMHFGGIPKKNPDLMWFVTSPAQGEEQVSDGAGFFWSAAYKIHPTLLNARNNEPA